MRHYALADGHEERGRTCTESHHHECRFKGLSSSREPEFLELFQNNLPAWKVRRRVRPLIVGRRRP